MISGLDYPLVIPHAKRKAACDRVRRNLRTNTPLDASQIRELDSDFFHYADVLYFWLKSQRKLKLCKNTVRGVFYSRKDLLSFIDLVNEFDRLVGLTEPWPIEHLSYCIRITGP